MKQILCVLLATVVGTALLFGDGAIDGSGSRQISVIPLPFSLKRDDGSFLVGKATTIVVGNKHKDLLHVADQLAARLRMATGYPLHIEIAPGTKEKSNAIVLTLDTRDLDLGTEGYRLAVTKRSVVIKSSTPSGVFYGVQTLYQLLPVQIEAGRLAEGVAWAVPCVRIEDKPRFRWRGMHLDVGRHFFTKDSIKRYLDLLAMYKMNTFHWHLTEDQGWRIEIKKYPRLTSVGSWRKETMDDNVPHGGFYTQDDVREIVDYARERFITIVPEIEMPGHSQAALAAYPELSCSGGPFRVGTEWGVIHDVYCAGKEKTFEFLEAVIEEVTALFPGVFFHIGGDEVPKTRWSNCRWCQDRIRAEGMNDERELQSYFIKRIEKMLTAKAKRLVGWDEILEGGLAPNATVMSWRGTQGGIDAAKSGHDVVMTPTSHCYFDYYQGVEGEPKAIGGHLPIDTVYSFEPVPSDLTDQEAKHVLGAQGNVWTEWMPHFRQVEYMALPRLCAMSEVVWSEKSQRSLTSFMLRLQQHYDRLALRDVNFRVPTPLGIGGRKIIFRDTLVAITSPIPTAAIYFTLDSQEPTAQSPKYEEPLRITGDQVLKAQLALPNGRMSNPVTTYFFTVDPMRNGVDYRYFEGSWEMLPDFNALTPVRSGQVYDIDLQSFPHREDDYGVQFTTYLNLPTEGDYTFSLASDDGSRLYINGQLLINNDGLHGLQEAVGKVNLAGGKHKLEVWFFERWGNQGLSVSIEGPRMQKQPLPPSMLTRE